VELVERREEAHWLWKHFVVSQRRICERMGVAESGQRYVSRRNDEALRERLVEAAEFARRVAALRSPTAPCALQLEELAKEKIMSSRDFGVV